MARTPDRRPGRLLEEEILLDDLTADGDPTDERAIRYASGEFRLRDSLGVFNARSLTEEEHKALRVLVHLADGGGPYEGFASGAYKETLPAGNPFPTSIIWWESSGKLEKIVEKAITYTGIYPTTVAWKAYDTDGTTVLLTVTDTIVYNGPFEEYRTRTIS